MREWLSGRASPCQGERREFESRLPLQKKGVYITPFHIWRHSQVVRQRSATPLSPVQIWVAPPKIKALILSAFIFVFVSVRTQHHYERSEYIILPLAVNIMSYKRTQNDVAR